MKSDETEGYFIELSNSSAANLVIYGLTITAFTDEDREEYFRSLARAMRGEYEHEGKEA
jgi:hypothetical protein